MKHQPVESDQSAQTNAVAAVAPTATMAHSSLSNARWVVLSQLFKILSQLISITVLARLLPPQAYGLMALAAVVTNLAYLFRDLGTSAAVIQAKTISPAMTSTIHWSNVGLGLLIALMIVSSAPFMAHVFHEPGLRPVLYLLALVFPVSSLSVVHQALLERASNFSVVVKAEIIAALSGLGVALLLAWQEAGVFSLVGQILTTTLLTTLLMVWRSGFRPRFRWDAKEFKSILGFSGNLSLFNFVLYFSRNADSMVIGKLLGTTLLGVYSMAYRIMLFPLQNLTYVAARALYPVMSRQHDNPLELASLYLKTVSFIAFLTAPLMAGLFVLREPFVQVVLGDKWHAATSVLAWLAPVGLIQSLVSTTGTVLMAKGRTHLLLRLGLLGAILQVTAFFVGSIWGIEGVAAAYLVANLVNALPAFYFSGRLIGVTLSALGQRIAPPLALALLMVVIVQMVEGSLISLALDHRLKFLLLVLLGMAVYGVASLWLQRGQVMHLQSFLKLQRS